MNRLSAQRTDKIRQYRSMNGNNTQIDCKLLMIYKMCLDTGNEYYNY